MLKPQAFGDPIYVTRPILPKLTEFSEALASVWDSQWLTNNGQKHQKLEHQLQSLLKVPYLSLFNNGTIALFIGCQSLKLSGEVITTPFTFPATPHALTWNGVEPVFCDIDPTSMNIDSRQIESLITPKTTGILGVHVYGIPCNVHHIQAIADKHNLKVVYDAAHAFGLEIDGVGIGNFGDISMLSFHATKLFHTAEGGALLFSDPALKTRIDLLKNFGIKNEEEVVLPGINGKMNEIQATLGLVLLEQVQQERTARADIAKCYRQCLSGIEGISLMPEFHNVRNSYQYFVIRIDKALFKCSRDDVYTKLKEYNVFARKYFYPLCSSYPCYSHLASAQPAKLPVANRIAEEVLSLPFYGQLSVNDVERICAMIRFIRDEHA